VEKENAQKPRRLLPCACLLLVTGAILVLIPGLCLAGAVNYVDGQQSGEHSRWRSLGAPPHGGAEFITGDPDVVYVRTAAGDTYACRYYGSVGADTCWYAVQEPLKVHPNIQFDDPLFEGDVDPPPGTVVDALHVTAWERDASFEARYVLLQDGTVWKWEYDAVGYSGLIIIVLALFAGLILAGGLVIALWLGFGLHGLLGRARRQT
jgi:hypothetical protein